LVKGQTTWAGYDSLKAPYYDWDHKVWLFECPTGHILYYYYLEKVKPCKWIPFDPKTYIHDKRDFEVDENEIEFVEIGERAME